MRTFADLKLPPKQQQPRPVNITRNGTESLLASAAYDAAFIQSSIQHLADWQYVYETQLSINLRISGTDLYALL